MSKLIDKTAKLYIQYTQRESLFMSSRGKKSGEKPKEKAELNVTFRITVNDQAESGK